MGGVFSLDVVEAVGNERCSEVAAALTHGCKSEGLYEQYCLAEETICDLTIRWRADALRARINSNVRPPDNHRVWGSSSPTPQAKEN